MPAPQPATLARQLFDRLGRVADQGIPDELELRRLEKDANALMRVDPGQAHQVLGGLAALRWDFDKMRYHHEVALDLSGAIAYKNYAVSLGVLGFFAEAAKYMTIASEKRPEALSFLRSAISYTLWSGQPKKVLELIAELKKRDPDHAEQASYALPSKDLIPLMESHGVSERDLQSALHVAQRFLRDKRVRITHCSLVTDPAEDVAFFSMRVNQPISEVLALDAELGALLAEHMPDLSTAVVVQVERSEPTSTRANDSQAARPA